MRLVLRGEMLDSRRILEAVISFVAAVKCAHTGESAACSDLLQCFLFVLGIISHLHDHLNTNVVDKDTQIHVQTLFELLAQYFRRQIKDFSERFQRDMFLIVVVDVLNDLGNNLAVPTRGIYLIYDAIVVDDVGKQFTGNSDPPKFRDWFFRSDDLGDPPVNPLIVLHIQQPSGQSLTGIDC